MIDSLNLTQLSWNQCLKFRFPPVYSPCLFSPSLFFHLHYFKVSKSPQAYLGFFDSDFFLLYFKIFFSSSAIFNLFCFFLFSGFFPLSLYVIYNSAINANFSNCQFWGNEYKTNGNTVMTVLHLPLVHPIIHRTVSLITVVNIFTKLCSLNSSCSLREGPPVYHQKNTDRLTSHLLGVSI